MLESIGTVELLLLVEVMEVLVPVGVKVLRLLEVKVLRLLEVRGVSELVGMERLSVSVGMERVLVSVGMERLSVSVGMGRVSVELLVVSTDGVASGSPNQTDKQSRWGRFGIQLTSNA